MSRTITLTPENVRAVADAYKRYYAIATSEDLSIASSGTKTYEAARANMRRSIKAHTGIGAPARVEQIMEGLFDNFGYDDALPGILRHYGYTVDDTAVEYARTYDAAREAIANNFPISDTRVDSQRGVGSYVLARIEGVNGAANFADYRRNGNPDDATARARVAAWLQASQDHADAYRATLAKV